MEQAADIHKLTLNKWKSVLDTDKEASARADWFLSAMAFKEALKDCIQSEPAAYELLAKLQEKAAAAPDDDEDSVMPSL
jgi:hypothetical protein